MTKQQIKIAANSIAGLMEVSGCDLEVIKLCLEDNIISSEDFGKIEEYLESV